MKTKLVAAAMAGTLSLAPTTASAGLLWPGDVFTSTTTVAGIGALVYFFLIKPKQTEGEAVPQEKTKATFLYLKQNHTQLAQDLSEGQGPVIDELARTSNIREENRAVFAQHLQAHAGELLELSNPTTLDEERAVAFVQTYVSIVQAHPVLAGDLATVGG